MKNFEKTLRSHLAGVVIDPELSEPLRATSAEAVIAQLESQLGITNKEKAETEPLVGNEGEGEQNASE